MTRVKNGDKIKVEYTGSLDNGTIFDSSEGHGPLEFTVGSGQLIKGFDQAVLGMEKNEEKTVYIKMIDAYGEKNSLLLRKIPKNALPKEKEPQVGMILGLVRADGMQSEARIVEVSELEVTIDLNHPLAGKDLTFKIKVLEIN